MTEPHSGREYTYSELIDRVKRAASAFSRRGMRKGDIVLIISPNDIDYGVAFLALASLGAIMTTVNPASTARELKVQLTDSEAAYVITAASLAEKTREVTGQFKTIKEVFSFGKVEGMKSFAEIMAEDIDDHVWDDVHLEPDDVIILPYSSGTTGVPKGVMLTHRNVIAMVLILSHPDIAAVPLSGNLTSIMFVPFYHVYGMIVIFLASAFAGSNIILMPKFDFAAYLDLVQKYKVQVLQVVPPIAVLLAKHPIVDKYDFTCVEAVLCGAAPMGKQLAEDLMARLGIDCVRQGYGMTESGVTHLSPIFGWKHGSAGELCPSIEGKVVDIESGKDFGPNQNGEIWMRGPTVMKGYYKRPDATSHTIDKDGWIHTGDIGYYDEDNHFFIVDRLKELIKYKGFQVPPAELESLLLTHPGIADAAVVGVLDEMAGELPMAFIVKKEGSDITKDDIVSFVHENAAPHKRLRGGVEFVDTIPKSPSGKILRRVLKERITQNVHEDK